VGRCQVLSEELPFVRVNTWLTSSSLSRTSFNDALSIFKADDAMSIEGFPSQLKSLVSLYSNIYIDIPGSTSRRSPRTAKSLLRYLSSPVQPKSDYESVVESLSSSRRHPLAPLVAKLRTFKSEREQQVMRAAADISGRAHAKVSSLTVARSC
jgi:intermediate cleaving peptidase 55